ncbi:MAG: enoyl-CoA hydratase-related protein, partial [Pseudomonadota bacterium]
AADEVVAASCASLALPEIDLGMPSPLAAAMLAARASLGVVRRMVQQGESFGAAQALEDGLVDAVVEPGGLHDEALARARALARRTGHAYAGNKNWINRGLRAQLVEAAQAATALRQTRPNT